MGKNWTYIVLEGYCGEDWDCRTDKLHYKLKEWDKGFIDDNWEGATNSCYDPDFKPEPSPKECPGVPYSKCMEIDCPHFAWADVTRDFIKVVLARSKDLYEEEEEDGKK